MPKKLSPFDRSEYLLDLSIIPALPLFRRDLPKGYLLASATLDELLSGQASEQLAQVLTIALTPLEATGLELQQAQITVAQLREAINAYQALKRNGKIRVIEDKAPTDETIRDILEVVNRTVPAAPVARTANGKSVTPREAVGKHLGTTLTESAKRNIPIISRGRAFLSRVGAKAAVVLIPDWAVEMKRKKASFKQRFIGKRADVAVWLISGFLVVPLHLPGLAIAIPGGVLWAIDP